VTVTHLSMKQLDIYDNHSAKNTKEME